MKTEGKKLYLESVRGLAALAVVFAHLLAAFLPAAVVGPGSAPVQSQLATSLFFGLPLGFMVSGHFAVVIFFVLSGYVLTFLYFKTLDKNVLLKQAIKRYVRLGVPVFASVTLSAILLGLGFILSPQIAAITGSPEAGRVLNFVPSVLGAFWDGIWGVFVLGEAKYNPVLWTMRVELLGSFLVFFMAVLFSGFPKRWIFYGLTILFFWNTYYPCFIIGMALADLFSSPATLAKFKKFFDKKIVYLGLAIALFLGAFPGYGPDTQHTIYQRLMIPGLLDSDSFRIWQSFGAVILVLLVLVHEPWQRILSHKAFVWLGSVSFGLYLTHYLVVYSIGAFLFIHLLPVIDYKPAFLVTALIVVPFALATAWLWTRYVDRPTIALGRKLSSRLMQTKKHSNVPQEQAPALEPQTDPTS